jgi:hypothetical protein
MGAALMAQKYEERRNKRQLYLEGRQSQMLGPLQLKLLSCHHLDPSASQQVVDPPPAASFLPVSYPVHDLRLLALL